MPEQIIAGIDFGGTKIRTGVVDQNGELYGRVIELPTGATRPAEAILEDMARTVEEAVRSAGAEVRDLSGVGVGSPGPLDLREGRLLNAPNLPTMWDFPLRARLQERLGVPVFVNNDGNCFVLGEATFGSARGLDVVTGVTLGTGLGCGLVIGGRIFEGATGTATEIWCSPYLDATFEEYGAARGLVRAYKEVTGLKAEGKEIFKRAQAGEDAALEAWRRYGHHLGVILSYLVNVLDPDAIVVGGSVAAGWGFFHEETLTALHANINPRPREHLRLLRATLGELTGVLGAAALALQP